MIKAVFFDATETLIHLPKGVAYHYREVALRHGLNLDESTLRAGFRAAWKGMPPRAATNAARPDDDKGWWRELGTRVLAEHGATVGADVFEPYFEELYAHFTLSGVWELYPDVKPTLAALDGKYALGVISNFDRRLYAILDHLGITHHFDAIVVSSETGADKPDARIFHQALERLNVQPHEALHVGDDPMHDWQGAEAVGMRCFHINRKQNSLLDVPDVASRL
jgi:putative hydrolase of the HAD superfamily